MNKTVEIAIEDSEFGTLVFDAITEGDPGGRPVILLHGFPQTSLLWKSQLSGLAAAGYFAIAIDQRGYSPRARPESIEAYRSEFLTRDILSIADTLGFDRFHLVGHDWGGVVAWHIACRHGDRLLSVNILSTPHPVALARAIIGSDDLNVSPEEVLLERGDLLTDQAKRSSYMEFFRREGSEDDLLANEMTGLKLLLEASGLSQEMAAPYLKVLGNKAALRAGLNWYRATDLSSIQDLGATKVPTLFIWSTGDIALGPDPAYATKSYVEGPYRFEVLEGVSHWIADEVPDKVTELLLGHIGTYNSPDK